jgi:hypothetical protein
MDLWTVSDLAHKPPSSFLSDVEVASLRTPDFERRSFLECGHPTGNHYTQIRRVVALMPLYYRLWRVSFADRRRTGTDVQQLAGMYCSLWIRDMDRGTSNATMLKGHANIPHKGL